MSWIYVVIAGLLEVVWTLGLKQYAQTRSYAVLALTVASIVGSMLLLGLAARTLPIGTAYAVWVSIGVLGAVLGGALLFHEPLSVVRVLLCALLLASVIGLKLTA